ncbi:hypothetical protein M1349_04335 [Patescibacteria group bacterium]|nr:hypothetical protein [Patescibacteria group bacterium]
MKDYGILKPVMHSILIASKNSATGLEYALDFLKKKEISKFDVVIVSAEKTIGIGDVRNFQSQIFLKPSQGKEKGVIIDAATGITTEAQNSLLKVLEEPPANTYIIIIALNKDAFLPTILSRCKIIELNENETKNSNEFEEILEKLLKAGVGERLKIAQDVAKEKDSALLWVEGLILATRKKLKEKEIKSTDLDKYLIKMKRLQKGHEVIKNTNANLRLALENILLSLK